MSDEGKRWTIYVCLHCGVNYDQAGRCRFDGHPDLEPIDVIPASELDRLEARHQKIGGELIAAKVKAEARVRELLRAIRLAHASTQMGDVQRILAEALNAPAEVGHWGEQGHWPVQSFTDTADEERHKDG